MKPMLLSSLLLAVLFVGAAIWRLKALPDSISALVFLLERRWQWVWTLWLFAVALTLAPPLLDAMPDEWRFVGFLTVGSLLFVAAMPLVRHDENRAHYVLAVAAGVLSQLCVLVLCWPCLLLWGLMVVLLGKATLPDEQLPWWLDGKLTMVAECICAATVYASVYLAIG